MMAVVSFLASAFSFLEPSDSTGYFPIILLISMSFMLGVCFRNYLFDLFGGGLSASVSSLSGLIATDFDLLEFFKSIYVFGINVPN